MGQLNLGVYARDWQLRSDVDLSGLQVCLVLALESHGHNRHWGELQVVGSTCYHFSARFERTECKSA